MTLQHEYSVTSFRMAALLGDGCFCVLLITACVGYLAGGYALLLALIATPLLLLLGYGIQYLFLDREAYRDRRFNFMPDESVVYLPRSLAPVSYLLTVGAAVGLGYLTVLLFRLINGAESGSVGDILVLIGFAVTAFCGHNVAAKRAAAFTSFQGHVIAEVMAPYVITAALFSVAPLPYPGFDLLLYALALLTLCAYAFLFNQLSLARLSAMATTCHITGKMILCSLRELLVILGLGAVVFLASLSVATSLYALVQIFLVVFLVSKGADGMQSVGIERAVFGEFPTRIIPLNMALFGIGCVALVLLLFFFTYGRAPEIRAKMKKFFGSIHDRMTMRPSARRAEVVAHRVEMTEYSDYIAPAKIRRPKRYYPDSLREIERKLESITDGREKLAYAYRTMVERLVRANLGISVTDTPREVAETLKRRGVMQDAAELTRAFEWAAYASPDAKPTEGQPLSRIMQVIRIYTPR